VGIMMKLVPKTKRIIFDEVGATNQKNLIKYL